MLFSHFKIAHYHLGNFVDERGQVTGTQDIMYVYLDSSRAIILDVGPHDFTFRNAYRLFGVFAETVPEVAKITQMHGVSGLSEEPSNVILDSQIRGSFVSAFEVNGNVYCPPSMGTVSSGHIINAVRCLDEISEWWEERSPIHEPVSIEVIDNKLMMVSNGKAMVETLPII